MRDQVNGQVRRLYRAYACFPQA